MKRTTLEEVKNRLKKVHGDLVTIIESTYTNTQTKAAFTDKNFGIWMATPSMVLSGRTHPKRGILKRAASYSTPIEEIVCKLNKIHGGAVTLVESTYVNATSKATFIDKDFGAWQAIPLSILRRKSRHPKKSAIDRACKQRQDIETVKRRLTEVHGDNVTLDESTYTKIRSKATFIDKDYGPWNATVDSVINYGSGHNKRSCANAGIKQSLDIEIVRDKLEKIHGGMVTIDASTYSKINRKATFIDKDYGPWSALPNAVVNKGCGHPKRGRARSSVAKTLPVSEIISRLKEVHGETVTIESSTYSGMNSKATFIDKEFGAWQANPGNVLSQGTGHPERTNRNSKPQREILEWIASLDVIAQESAKIGDSNFEIDIFVPALNLGIEYNGLFWHSEKYKSKNAHVQKRQLCEDNGIRLLQFNSDEWEFKKEIVKSIIASHLRIGQKSIFARKCEIRTVLNKDAQVFLDQNHLMGMRKFGSAKYVGLFNKDVLVSLLGYKRRNNKIEISRFCNMINHVVPGGLSRLLKFIKNSERPKSIVSRVDLRYSDGSSLLKIGFVNKKETIDWRWTDRFNTFNRLKCRANMDNRGMTENEHAKELGFLRIYDAGQRLFKIDCDKNK